MSPRMTTTCFAIGLAAAFTLGTASTSAAQTTTDTSTATTRSDTTMRSDTTTHRARSSQRMRVRKETGASSLDTTSSSGAIATPRRDTTTTRTDTTVNRTDTTTKPNRTDTTMNRTDTTRNPADTTMHRTDTTRRDTTMRRDTTVRDSAAGDTGARHDTSATKRDTTRRDTTAVLNPPGPSDVGMSWIDTVPTTRTDTTPVPRDTTGNPVDTTTRTDTLNTRRDTLKTRDSTTVHDTTMVHDTTVVRDTTGMPRDTTRRDTTGAITTTTTTTTTAPAARRDTLVSLTQPAPGSVGNGFYIGVGGGGSIPTGNFSSSYSTGWNVSVPIGWRSLTTPWGLQLDLTYDQPTGRRFSGFTLANPNVWSGLLDLTVNFPMGTTGRSSIYLLGGAGLHHFTDFATSSSSAGGPLSSTGSMTKWGWNVGGGLSFEVSPATSLFLESRFVDVATPGKHSTYVPIIVGFRFF